MLPPEVDPQVLVGETVQATLIDTEHGTSRVLFVCRSGKIVEWMVEGDCCSESWFADFVGWDNLFGGEITAVETLPLPEWVQVDDGRGKQDVDVAYGYKITTERGYVDIVYRNSSNGYYGGWMYACLRESVPDGLIEVRADWRSV